MSSRQFVKMRKSAIRKMKTLTEEEVEVADIVPTGPSAHTRRLKEVA